MKEAKSQSWVESTFPKDIHQNGLPEMQKKKKSFSGEMCNVLGKYSRLYLHLRILEVLRNYGIQSI